MNIYIICAVRNASEIAVEQIRRDVKNLRQRGDVVHFPPDDVDQNDPTGQRICEEHLQAMIKCDEVHVYWDVDSKGSHFDLGMAYALEKDIIPICLVHPDPLGKSYWKAVIDV